MRSGAAIFGALLALAACSQTEENPAPAAADTSSSPADAAQAKAPAPTGPLAPRDECAPVEGLGELQAALGKAVAARDADALLALVDEDVVLDFGGGAGHAELRKRLTSPDYMLWDEIERALALGCGLSESADGGSYAAWPWYFAKDVIPLDPYEAMIVTANDVPLRESASADAEQIGAVSWDYVQVTEYSDAPYVPVTTREGQEGYMDVSQLRSLVDYRVMADKADDGWKVTAIVAGD